MVELEGVEIDDPRLHKAFGELVHSAVKEEQ
jgi:hypothetical protein